MSLLLTISKEKHDVLQGFTAELQQWDLTYWSEQLREAKFNISDEALRPYFSLPNVLDGLFKVTPPPATEIALPLIWSRVMTSPRSRSALNQAWSCFTCGNSNFAWTEMVMDEWRWLLVLQLTGRLFNVEIKAADGQAPVWHKDVRFFKLFLDGKPKAYFYLDPYSRPAGPFLQYLQLLIRSLAWKSQCHIIRPLYCKGLIDFSPNLVLSYLWWSNTIFAQSVKGRLALLSWTIF